MENKVEDLCLDVLRGKISPEEAKSHFKHEQLLYRLTSDLEIEILPKTIASILRGFLKHTINENEIKEWALFVLMSDAFVTPNWREDNSFQYDDMWTILARLSAPEIDGKITEELIKKYILELEFL